MTSADTSILPAPHRALGRSADPALAADAPVPSAAGRAKEPLAPKIYYLHPLVAGPLREWPAHFRRIGSLGFNWVCVAPAFEPGERGDIFLPRDLDTLHPALAWNGDATSGLAFAAAEARQSGLQLMLDVRLDRFARTAPIRAEHPGWFEDEKSGALPDPRRPPPRLDASYARLQDTTVADAWGAWWSDRLQTWLRAGVRGFRYLRPERVPTPVWRRVLEELRHTHPDVFSLAWTVGIGREAAAGLRGLGFDRAAVTTDCMGAIGARFIEEVEAIRQVAPLVGCPEPSFQERVAHHLPAESDPVPACRQALRMAAVVGSGLFVPMGFEFATPVAFDSAEAMPADFARARERGAAELGADLAEAAQLLDSVARLSVDGAMRILSSPAEPSFGFLRANAPDVREASIAAVVLVNSRADEVRPFKLDGLPPQAGAAFGAPTGLDGQQASLSPLAAHETRVLVYRRLKEVRETPRTASLDAASLRESRIAIEAVSPVVPDGDFPAKTVVGTPVTVSADIFIEGHDALSASLKWRAADERDWHEVAFHPTGNDRWEATFTPSRVGRFLYTIEAWWDAWATFRHDLHAKHHAGQQVGLEIREGRGLIEAARAKAAPALTERLNELLDQLTDAEAEVCVAVLLSPEALAAMQAADRRPFLATLSAPIPVRVDRPQASFASWYELFPRSVTSDPNRHGTFRDMMARLPAIRAMGFDVLYFPPIHPIGKTNRKGRNNALRAEEHDVGSPYAIGDAQGGHDALHAQLGSFEDFRALIAEAKAFGLEIALDFAIQCSPDHPWLKQHPEWFRRRPDGTLRYAENPPKKYEDIVNPDFFGDASIPSLWLALRDVIAFWIGQGIQIFRVDNPHTKPLPFWRWMIGDIQSKHPGVIFLAEAFTRPKMMMRLAKVGFTQSYTYFTWRNSKAELTEYMQELVSSPARECFRPNFFVNTPDINPVPLQTSGRPGFLMRAALAATLSGSWGLYSGFEICEAAPLPGREEYLDSEKYEIRVRDFNAPGNITAEITALNQLRRSYPALQDHLNITFYEASNPNVLLYGKQRPGEREIVLVAVSLDVSGPQDSSIALPLWQLGLPDHAGVHVRDLMRDVAFTWTGKYQQVRIDPTDLPFAIWHITLPGSVA